MSADRRTFEAWFDQCRSLQQALAELEQQFARLEAEIDPQWPDWYARAPRSTREILGPDGYRQRVWPARREILARQAAPAELRQQRSRLKHRLKLAEHALQRRAQREGVEIA